MTTKQAKLKKAVASATGKTKTPASKKAQQKAPLPTQQLPKPKPSHAHVEQNNQTNLEYEDTSMRDDLVRALASNEVNPEYIVRGLRHIAEGRDIEGNEGDLRTSASVRLSALKELSRLSGLDAVSAVRSAVASSGLRDTYTQVNIQGSAGVDIPILTADLAPKLEALRAMRNRLRDTPVSEVSGRADNPTSTRG